MRRLFHSSWIALVALLAAALGALYFAGWTEAGLQTLATQLSRRVGPVTLKLEGARGTLAHGAQIDRFTLDHRRTHIEAENIRLSVSMPALFAMNIHVNAMHVDRLLVHVLPRPDDNSDWKPHFLRAPLIIEAPEVHVAEGTLIATNGRRFDVSGLTAGGSVRAYSIVIDSSSMDYAGVRLIANGEVKAATPIGLAGRLRVAASPPGQPAWFADATFNGNLDRLPVNGEITQPLSASFAGAAVKLNGGDWSWSAQTQLRRLDLRAWGGGNALGVITGPLQITGDHNGLRATGQLTPPGLKSGPIQVSFDGSYADRVLTARQLQLTHQPSGASLSATGSIGIVAHGPRLELDGHWQNFRWPLADGNAPIHSPSGEYGLHGLWPFGLRGSGAVRIRDLPVMPFTASGQLAHDHLQLDTAELTAWGGKATLQGEARWAPAQSWQLTGLMHGFVLEQFRPGVHGLLNFRLDARGDGFGGGGTLLAHLRDLSGTVRGQRASGQAQAELAGEDWLLSNVRLQLGATRISADGRVGSHLDLRFDVDASDLGLLHADAQGQLRARGALRTTGAWPSLQLDATGTGILWENVAVQSLKAKVQFEPQEGGRADADVQIRSLKYGQRVADSIDFHSSGITGAHHATLALDAPQLQLKAGGDAALRDGLWQWTVAELRAEDGRNLQLDLEAPTHLRLSADEFTVDRMCLKDTHSRICGQTSNRNGQRSATLSAENMPLRALTAGLSDATEFDGTLGVEASASAAADDDWRGRLRAQLRDAAIRHRYSSGRVETFSLGTGDVGLDLDSNGLAGTVALNAGEAGKVSGHASARSSEDSWRDWPLAGQVQLESNALGLLDSYIPEIDRASGRIAANLGLAGTLASPQLNGDLSVRGARVDAYAVNLAVRDLNLDATLRDGVLNLEGTAAAGVDGKAKFNGNLHWQEKLPYGNLHVSGENLLIVNIPEAKIIAAPNVDLRLSGRRIDVTGTIDLPYARLEQPDNLAAAVRSSRDEVIVTTQDSAPADRTPVYSNVTLKLGDRVTINTTGLQGRLSGSITAISDETGWSRGSGELNIEEGKYTAYGRKLDITRGRLTYNNSALGDPGVDLRAVKQFPDIIAGVNVRGSLASPSVTFFSDPTIPQSQIVSLLLAGGSLDTVQNADPATRTDVARNNMILQGSAMLAQQFGNRLGTDVSVEQNLQNDTSLVLGRYLSPRLYLSYGIGLAEAINTIKLNYTIGDKWTIRTEAGQARSADLVYTIRK